MELTPPSEPTTVRPQGPRTGRRAASNLVPSQAGDAVPAAPSGPKPQVPRRRGGWAEDSNVSIQSLSSTFEQLPSTDTVAANAGPQQLAGVSRRKAAQMTAKETREPDFAAQTVQIEAVDTFMEIPDLEAEEDMSRQVAAAPAMRSVSVVNIAELESEDLFQLPAIAKDREVDLSLLIARLCPANEVAEEQVPWDYEALLGEVASELNAEKQPLYGISADNG